MTFTLIAQNGKGQLPLDIRKVFNVGYAGRDREVVRKHVEELAALGVPGPSNIPAIYPVSSSLLCFDRHIQVQHGLTSGEIEYVLLYQDGKCYVTVGSDHSDRDLEKTSVPWAKQVYPNILAPEVWDLEEVAGHWDQVILRCTVTENGAERVYQEGTMAEILSPAEQLEEVRTHFAAEPDKLAIYSGTLPAIGGMAYPEGYRIEMIDPVLDRRIETAYTVEVLPPPVE